MTDKQITIYEGDNPLSKHLLNKYELEEFIAESKIAYVDSITEAKTRQGKTFFKFNLRDTNGMIVTGRLFDVEETEEAGNVLRKLKRKVVKVIYQTINMNNEIQLNLEAVNLSPDEYQELDKHFLGTVEGLDILPSKILNHLTATLQEGDPLNKYVQIMRERNLLQKIKGRALEAYSWKLGSGLLHINNVLESLTGTPLDKGQLEWIKVCYVMAEAFINNERELDDTDLGTGFLSNLNVLTAFLDTVAKQDEENSVYHKTFKEEVTHLVQVRLETKEPNTLTAYAVKATDKTVRDMAYMNEQHKSMMSKTSRQTALGKLVKH